MCTVTAARKAQSCFTSILSEVRILNKLPVQAATLRTG